MENLHKILVVDDTPENLHRLHDILKEDYKLSFATSGKQALKLLEEGNIPELIILDIVMPWMDGFEVCESLKKDDRFRDIPVVFVSSLEEIDQKLRAFSSGGIDFVTKPFEPNELKVRISTHLSLQEMKTKLREQNQKLDEMVKHKTRELEEAYHRLEIVDRSKNEFLQLISHELRTPANGVFGISELLIETGEVDDDLRELYCTSRDRLLSTLDEALMLAGIHVSPENFKYEPILICKLLRRVVESTSEALSDRHIGIRPSETCSAHVQGNIKMMEIALSSLLLTAASFTDREKEISISIAVSESTVEVNFHADGSPVDAQLIRSFFEVFSTSRVSSPAESLGLKPALARSIIALYSGEVSIGNSEANKVLIKISLPRISEEALAL